MAFVQRKGAFVGTPETHPPTKPFFDGCAAGKLVIPRCKDTGKYIWYPRGISPFTFGEIEWVEVSGKGKIYTFSVMERAGFVGFALVMVLFVIGFTNDLGRLMGEGFNVR